MADATTTESGATAAGGSVLRDLLDQTHPDYDYRVNEWNLLGDLWDGTGGVSAPYDVIAADNGNQYGSNFDPLPGWKRITYLDRYPRESDSHFRSRIRSAAYENYLRDIGETILGFLLRRPNTVSGLPSWLEEWESTCGAGGSSLDTLERIYATRMLVYGSCPILLDRPSEQVSSQAEARRRGIRTKVLPLWPQSMRAWMRDDEGALEWVTLKEIGLSWPDPLSSPVERSTWRVWSREQVLVASLIGTDAEQTTATVSANPVPGMVPVVWAQFGDSVGQSEIASSPLKSCGDICRAIFNRQSEKVDFVRGQLFPVLCIPEKFKGEVAGVKLGTDSALPVSVDGNMPSYIAPPGGIAGDFTDEVERLIRALYRQARIDWTETGAESGYARAQRFHRTNTQIVSFALRLAEVRRSIYEMACRWERRDPARELADLQIVTSDDFDVADLSRALEQAEAAKRIGLGPTAEAEIAKGVRNMMVDIRDPQRLADSDAEIEAEAQALRGTMPPAGQTDPGMSAEPVEPEVASSAADIELGVSTMASIITMNEARASRGLGPLRRPDGSLDPDGALTIADFDAKREAARSAQADTAVVPG